MENRKTTYIMLPMRADSKLNSGSVADLVLDCQYGAIWPAIICPLINFSISLCNNPIILSFWSYLIQRLALWQLFNRIPVYFVTLIPFDCDVEMFVWICRNMQIYLNFMLSLSTGPTIKLYLYHHYAKSQNTYMSLRSREYRFTHMNRSTVDIPFLSEALSGERIWVIIKGC